MEKREEKKVGNFMRYVVLVSHGELASGMHSVVKMIAGDRPEVYSICLKQDMDAGIFMEECEKVFSMIPDADQIILLTDILSGSPIINALSVLENKGRKDQSIIIGGMNMPMVLEAVFKKDHIEDLSLLKGTLIEEAKKGIK